MAKSSRASVVKRNNSRLKSKVFGPVEQARAERLNKKLLELAQLPKPTPVKTTNVDAVHGEGAQMDGLVESGGSSRSNTELKKARELKKSKIEKRKKRSKERNRITFKKHPMKSKR